MRNQEFENILEFLLQNALVIEDKMKAYEKLRWHAIDRNEREHFNALISTTVIKDINERQRKLQTQHDDIELIEDLIEDANKETIPERKIKATSDALLYIEHYTKKYKL